jgi:hypothetical protein
MVCGEEITARLMDLEGRRGILSLTPKSAWLKAFLTYSVTTTVYILAVTDW